MQTKIMALIQDNYAPKTSPTRSCILTQLPSKLALVVVAVRLSANALWRIRAYGVTMSPTVWADSATCTLEKLLTCWALQISRSMALREDFLKEVVDRVAKKSVPDQNVSA